MSSVAIMGTNQSTRTARQNQSEPLKVLSADKSELETLSRTSHSAREIYLLTIYEDFR